MRPLTCPICHKVLPATASDSAAFPFCSERCRDVDLLRWCKGSYAIVEEVDPEQLQMSMQPPDPEAYDE
jgi:hypothetical protein